MTIDISSPTAYEREATGVGSVGQLLGNVGKIEGMRRDRDILNRYVTAMAADPTADPAAIIAGLAEPQYDTGLLGAFQKIAGGMPGGQGSVLPQLQAGQVQTPLQRAQTKATEALGEARSQPKAPKKPTAAENKKVLSNLVKEFPNAPPERSIEILKEAESLENVTESASASKVFTDDLYEKQVKVFKGKRVKVGKLDKANGEDVYKATLDKLLQTSLEQGVLPSTVVAEFNKWWDKQAAKTTLGFREFVPRTEFEGAEDIEAALPKPVTKSTPQDIRPGETPRPTTQAEFDAIPSGTEFVDTDGQRKRKK